MDRNRKRLTRATVIAAAVITTGLTVVIAASRVARADLDPQAADYAVMDEDLYGALVVAILGFVVCLVALGIHWVVRGRGAQGRDAPSTSAPLWLPLVVGVQSATIGIDDSPGWYCAFHSALVLYALPGLPAFSLRRLPSPRAQPALETGWSVATGQLGAGLAWRCAGTEAPVPVPKTHLSSCVLNRLCLLFPVISR